MKRSAPSPRELARELAQRAAELRQATLLQLQQERARPAGERPALSLYATFTTTLAAQTAAEFADAYAQTLTYGLLGARWLTRAAESPFCAGAVDALLPGCSPFVRELFTGLLGLRAAPRLGRLIDDLARLLDRTEVGAVFARSARDPIIHFYEDFLEEYDPQLRQARGVYYTPAEVVAYMVRAADAALRSRFGLPLGLADPTSWAELARARGTSVPPGVDPEAPFVQVLDPAAGTGTFLLHVIAVVHETMQARFAAQGLDAAAAGAAWVEYVRRQLLPRLHGCELMMAPYLICHLRLGLALSETGFQFAESDELRVLLTSTLELQDPPRPPGRPGSARRRPPPAAQARAQVLKAETPISVVLGNPPYAKQARAARSAEGQWLLAGEVPGRSSRVSLFDDLLAVARAHTVFSHHAALYNLYVYFWRWALWKALEQRGGQPGLVALVTASSWLSGPGFVGLRKLARELADELFTIDLGGDQLGTEPEPNVFAIKSAVAITMVLRAGAPSASPARAQYLRVSGASAAAKLATLLRLAAAPLAGPWQLASAELLKPLLPPTGGAQWLALPALADLCPWQQPGCMFSRLWPICPQPAPLLARWREFVAAPVASRAALYQTPAAGRNIHTRVGALPPLAALPAEAPPPPLRRYGWRSFDRQWVLADPRLAKTESPSLWQRAAAPQVFFAALISKEMSAGPAITVTAHVPDKDFFCGRGGKDILPLYREPEAGVANVTAGLLDCLARRLGRSALAAEELAAYFYAVLSAPGYWQRFAAALQTPGPRVPLTCDPALWQQAAALGRQLIWLHTYGERYQDPEAGRGEQLPAVPGLAWVRPPTRLPATPRELAYAPDAHTLTVGDGVVGGVQPEVWEFRVSGMQVVKKWLGYRTQRGAGRAARSPNPLDQLRPTPGAPEWRDDLLELLRLLTCTVALRPAQEQLLDRICSGPLILAAELPVPTAAERREPRPAR